MFRTGHRLSPARSLALLLIIGCIGAAVHAGDSTKAEEDLERATRAMAAQKGIVSGSLNPARRGLAIPSQTPVLIIPMKDENSRYGMIDDWMAAFIERRLNSAVKEKYGLVILEIDTNGGMVDSCERINRAIANSPVPVVAFVTGKAFSGGALVSLGCRMIVMAPATQIGGAKVVSLFMNIPSDVRPKVDAEIRAQVLGLSTKNNHPGAIAVGMVNDDTEVWETNHPTQRFMLLEDLEAAERTNAPPARVKQWKQKGAILSLTDVEARNAGLSSGTVGDFDELYIGLGVKPSSVNYARITGTETVARFLGHPLWRVLLVLIGIIGLVLELKSPGHGVGFIVFGFCLGLFFWLQLFAATAGLAEILIFGLGAILVAVELFILPGFGFVGFAGFACILVSIVLSFLPEGAISKSISGDANPGDRAAIRTGLNYALLTVVVIVGGAIVALWKGAALPGLNRLALKTETGGVLPAGANVTMPSGPPPEVKSPLAPLVGQDGVAETMLRPGGKVRVGERTFDALAESGFIDAGKAVRVIRATARELIVREQA